MTEKVEETKDEFVTVFFYWQVLRPDIRQYKQQSIELIQPELRVAVSVPSKYVFYASGESKEVTLTLEGMKYVQDQFEKLYAEEKDTKVAASTDDWGSTPETATPKAEDDDWGAAAVFDETDKPSNKPDTESWDDSKEDWE